MFFTPGRFISPKKISQYNIHLFQQQYSKSTSTKSTLVQKPKHKDINNDNNDVSYIYKKVYR